MPNGGINLIRGLLQWILPRRYKFKHTITEPSVRVAFFVLQSYGLAENFRLYRLFATFAAVKNIMGRIIGIDYGRKRIGLAVTDPLQIFASPLTTISPSEFDNFMKDYLLNERVEAFVIGYPRQMNNLPSESVKYIDPFIRKLKKSYPEITVHCTDERFSSQIAFRSMIDGGVKKEDRKDKAMVDRISASIILQSFLDTRSNMKCY